jgi:hypothetical protein
VARTILTIARWVARTILTIARWVARTIPTNRDYYDFAVTPTDRCRTANYCRHTSHRHTHGYKK